jgi:hypothetical protein
MRRKGMPPLLTLHGQQDYIIPFRRPTDPGVYRAQIEMTAAPSYG